MYNPLKAETIERKIEREQTSDPTAVSFAMRLMIALDVNERRAAQGFPDSEPRAAEAREQLRILQNITPENRSAFEFIQRCELDRLADVARLLKAVRS